MTRILLCFALVAALFELPAAADTCTMPANGAVLRYWPLGDETIGFGDRRCDWHPDGPSCRLKGWLFTPASGGTDLPAIVYIHGSGAKKRVSELCEIVSYFVGAGYVFWVPYPRGYQDPTPGVPLTNTGIDVVTYVDSLGLDGARANAQATVDEMKQELHHEIADALDFLTTQPGTDGSGLLVDPGKIALAGHSFGGITVALGARVSFSTMPAAIIDMSGGVLSWPSAPDFWDNALGDAFEAHNQPIFVFQTPNESPAGIIASTVKPFLRGNGHGTGSSQMAVFSDVPDIGDDNRGSWPSFCDTSGATNECVHLAFVRERRQVMRWAPDVKAFLHHYGIK